jgi:hypothetical protein
MTVKEENGREVSPVQGLQSLSVDEVTAFKIQSV